MLLLPFQKSNRAQQPEQTTTETTEEQQELVFKQPWHSSNVPCVFVYDIRTCMHSYLHAYAPRFKVLLMLMRFIYGLNHISLFSAFIYLLICVYPSQVSVAVLGCWNSSVQLTHYYVFVFVAWLPEGLNVLNLNDFSSSAVVLFCVCIRARASGACRKYPTCASPVQVIPARIQRPHRDSYRLERSRGCGAVRRQLVATTRIH